MERQKAMEQFRDWALSIQGSTRTTLIPSQISVFNDLTNSHQTLPHFNITTLETKFPIHESLMDTFNLEQPHITEFHSYETSRIGKLTKKEYTLDIVSGEQKGVGEMNANRYRFLLGDKNFVKLQICYILDLKCFQRTMCQKLEPQPMVLLRGGRTFRRSLCEVLRSQGAHP